MLSGIRVGALLALASAAAMWGCGADGPVTAPSSIAPQPGPARLAVHVPDHHEPGDEHDHGPMPGADPTPAPEPLPGPEPFPAPEPIPAPMPGSDPALPPDAGVVPPPDAPPAVIDIVGSFGPGAFMPNPTVAPMGHSIVWTNSDVTLHRIVLADGTLVGDLLPGQTSEPIAVAAPSVTFLCTIHPSMVGTVLDPTAVDPVTGLPPIAEPPPYDYQDPYGGSYQDPYGDAYGYGGY